VPTVTAATNGASTAIGGMVLPVNKAQVLAPWLFLLLVLAAVITKLVFRLRKRP